MATSSKVLSEHQRERIRKRKQRQALTPLLYVAAGLLLMAGAYYAVTKQGVPKAALDYRPEDVVYGSPLLAVHEMESASLASIPFLPKDGPQPRIVVSEDFYNFGSIGLKEVAKHEFIIANLGDAPLTISRAYTTCGCTTAEFTATVIPPGKVVIMTLILDAGFHDVGGQTVTRGVIIENNDPDNPEIEIWTSASIRTTP